ncbi:TRAP transporter small permease [Hominifimenecus sp. rT4P-3]|uniref:TRAP transporter small permease n=1 Tax=Hominifimenecus sp. rT4P-3 TaxID=3242979 RepID=UPI003DA5582C
MKKVGTWLDENLEGTLLMVFLAAFSCVMMLQVIMRYLFSSALPWAEEVCRYLFVYSAFLSVPYTVKKGLGIRVDVIYRLFPKALQKLLNYFYEILQMLFYGYLGYSSLEVIRNVTESGALTPALRIPMQYVYLIIPIGFGLGVVRLIQRFVYLITHKGETMKRESQSVLDKEGGEA